MEDNLITTQLNKLLRKRSFNGKETGQLLIYTLMYNAYKCDKVDLNKIILKYQQAYKMTNSFGGFWGIGSSFYDTYSSLHVGLCFMVNYNFAYSYKIAYFNNLVLQELKEVTTNKKNLQLDNSFWECNLANLENWINSIKIVLAYNELLKIFEEVYDLENLSKCLRFFNTDTNLNIIELYNNSVEELINIGKYSKKDILKAFKRIDIKELYPKKINIKKIREHIENLGTSETAINEYKYYLLEYIIDMAGVRNEKQ